ncbi:PlsB [Desulfamplus magnetovallimortis]|uniref:Glycerol-3-phosphate acyltransferase n=1 Tax=Desulfamplus magnetovallimortis TaxID=1246637 RepID=A0A1W1HDK6_9BACT|nr:1-acyl-sn-glycerol-3-phosphate acyltransferase [Desulfamplus magnetovallimortis]SLM30526.1 PlsB [Desulfamplus magnetovallimortis]
MSILIKLREAWNTRIQSVLGQNNDHFSCFYPGNSGFLPAYALDKIFRRIKIDKRKIDKLDRLNEKGIVIYVGKYQSLFEFLYYHTTLKKSALPYPEIAFGVKFFFLLPVKSFFRIIKSHLDHMLRHFEIKTPYSGYFFNQLSKGHAGFLHMIDGKHFYRRFIESRPDPLNHIIAFQKQSRKPVFLVPQAIVFSVKPVRTTLTPLDILLGSNEKPGKLKRLMAIWQKPEKISVEISQPLNLQDFLNRPDIRDIDEDFQAYALRTHLIDTLNRQKRSITGPVLKSREELTEDILTQQSLQTFMREHSEAEGQPLMVTHKKAASYIEEIAANYNLTTIQIFEKVLTWAFNNIFEGLVVDHDGLERIKDESKKAPVILAPCHKSHLDYLLLSYLMFKKNMACPHIAAGKNLSFWPLGPIFRGGGAFFLRRTFKGAVLYSRIFAAYIEKLLNEGFNIEFFIEGGRSRTGKLLSPKLGFLSMLIKAYRNGGCEDLIFMPTYVGYDRVLEEDAYLHEIEGGKKNPENLSQLIRARKFLKKKYGKVYIKFHEPISLNEYLNEKGIDLISMDKEQHMALCKSIGYKLINAINKTSIVTPHGIIASALLNSSGNSFSKRELMFRVNSYMNMLTICNAELADTLTIDPDLALNHVLKTFVSRKFIELADETEDEITDNTRFFVKDNKRPILNYYKNNAISFFIPAAYTAIAILKADTFQLSSRDLTDTYRFLQNFFIDEFSFDEEKTCVEHISTCIKAFVEDGILVPTPSFNDTYNLTSEGYRKLKAFSEFLRPFLESYKIALMYFEKYPKEKHDPKERVKKMQAKGAKYYKRREILLKESLSKVNYINASTFFIENGIAGSEDSEKIQEYKDIVEQLLNIAVS